MKRLLSVLLLGSMSLVSAQALEKTTLWKITGPKLEKPSYLFGTIHITCDATLKPAVVKALDETKQMYLELDMDEPGLQAKIIQGMMISGNEGYSDYLTKEDYAKLDAFLKKNAGMGLDMAKTMKPMLLSMALIPKMMTCPMKSFEQELMKVSAQQNEEILGLELYTDQLEAFSSIPMKEQVDELMKTVKDDMKKAKTEFANLMAVYNAGDIELLLKLSTESETSSALSKHQDVMLDKRNINWIPKIIEAAQSKPTFFGVGAAHLAGDKGVIKLLRKEGYKVEPVMLK